MYPNNAAYDRTFREQVYQGRKNKPKRRNFLSWGGCSILVLLFSVCFLIPLILILIPYAYFQVFDVIYPKVQVGGVAVGGLQLKEAKQKIDLYYNQGRMIRVTDGIHEKYLQPQELGMKVDAEQSAQDALNWGHGGDFLENELAFWRSIRESQMIEPIVVVDTQIALDGLQKINEEFHQPATPPTISFNNGQWETLSGEMGYEVNIEESLHQLILTPANILISASYNVVLKPIPAPEVDTSQVEPQAEALIKKAQQLKAYDAITNEWLDLGISRTMAAGWLKINVIDHQAQLSVDEQRIASDLEQISSQLGGVRYLDKEKLSHLIAQSLPQDQVPFLLVSHHPTTYVVQKGDTLLKISWRAGFPMWKIIEVNPGLDPDQLYSGQVLNLPSKDSLLPLDVIPNKRIVISISKQRLMVYQDNQQIKKFIISTGVDRSPTQPGVFQVLTHKANAYASVWDLYMPNFLGIYEAWPGFMNGIHGLPMLSNGTRLWANVLGKPASYGCIILDMNDSKFLYQWAENGVVVEILP